LGLVVKADGYLEARLGIVPEILNALGLPEETRVASTCTQPFTATPKSDRPATAPSSPPAEPEPIREAVAQEQAPAASKPIETAEEPQENPQEEPEPEGQIEMPF
jgi:hypothetical protein